MNLFRQVRRALVILWTFTRHRLWWAIYRDVVRSHLTNPDCACEADVLVERRARRVRAALEDLGPTFIKLGQFLSRRPDLLPPAYLEELSQLQEKAPAVPFEKARRRLEETCICEPRRAGHEPLATCLHCRGIAGVFDAFEAEPLATCLHCRGIAGVFDAFEAEPLATASLAQVHGGVYRGRRVAVKFLKPGVLDRLNLDLALLRCFRWVVGRGLGVGRNMPADEFVAEFRRALLEEVNFENEALNIDRFRDHHADHEPVRAPGVYWEFRRSDVLVMERIEGVSLRAWSGSPDAARRMARTLAEDFLKQVFVDNLFHADPHPGNVFVESDGRLVYLDFGIVGRLDPPARRAVIRLFRSILQTDPDMAAEAVLEAGRTDPASVDLAEFRADIDRIIQLYRRRGGIRWSDAVVRTSRRHRIRLPRSILLYAKAAMLNEALVTELDPEFEVLPAARRMTLPILERELADAVADLERKLPGELPRDLLRAFGLWLTETALGKPPREGGG